MRSQNIIFVLAVLVLSGSLIYIGGQLDDRGSRDEYTISVMGEGKTNMAPDSMVLSLAINELAATTQDAQAQSNAKVNQVKQILTTYNIPEKDIKTENVSVYEEFDWTDGGRKPLGYRATQTLTITISDGDYTTIGGQIIDDVAKIGGVQVNNTYFTLKDKNAAMATAREAAFIDAKAKAEQLASAAGLRVKRAISINDSSTNYYPGPIYPMMGKAEVAMDSMGGGADISAGEMEITVQIQVVFETK